MRIRYFATAVPLLLAGTLAATAPGTSQAAGNEGADPGAQRPKISAKAVATAPCKGKAQKKAFTGGYAGWLSTSSSTAVPGTEYIFKGPKKKKDTVFVTFTAPNTWNTASDWARVRVELDGVAMEPAATSNEYFYDTTDYGSFAGQYCAKVGKGLHKVQVHLDSFGASNTAYLNNPMVHVEIAQ